MTSGALYLSIEYTVTRIDHLLAETRKAQLDTCNVTYYSVGVIRTFADKHTQQLYRTGKSKRLPADLIARAVRRLEFIELAVSLDDLKVPPSNRLHALKGNCGGQHSISINDQWRICFRWENGDAYNVEITDYH